MPFQKCKAALESVEFLDEVLDEEMGSNFVDVVTQMAQDVSSFCFDKLICRWICFYVWKLFLFCNSMYLVILSCCAFKFGDSWFGVKV